RVSRDWSSDVCSSDLVEVRVAEEKLHLTGGDSNFDFEATYRSTNPRFTLAYQANDDLMFYGLLARGNKPGGFNSDVRLAPGDRRSEERRVGKADRPR